MLKSIYGAFDGAFDGVFNGATVREGLRDVRWNGLSNGYRIRGCLRPFASGAESDLTK